MESSRASFTKSKVNATPSRPLVRSSNNGDDVILLRHGETLFNVLFNKTRCDPGIRDPRLTQLGREQAAEAAHALASESVTHVLASPYTRAIQTANVVARALNVPLVIDETIRERYSYSCDVGTPRSVLVTRWPEYAFAHLDDLWWPDDEEPLSLFQARCDAFRRRMAASSDWRTTVVVTHWGVVRALTGLRIKNGEMLRHDPTSEANGTATLEP